jgi:hypothetical protein
LLPLLQIGAYAAETPPAELITVTLEITEDVGIIQVLHRPQYHTVAKNNWHLPSYLLSQSSKSLYF